MEDQALVVVRLRCHTDKARAILSAIEDYSRRFDCIVEFTRIEPSERLSPEPPDEAAVSTVDLQGRAPQEVFERLAGESEADFSLRMARVQSELAEERRKHTPSTFNPVEAFKGVFG